jgi:hypothetical protein
MTTVPMFKNLKGDSGKITVPGLGAVVGEFRSWNLMRREGNGPPVWTLHAVFRYKNETLLKNPKMRDWFKIRLQLSKDAQIDLCLWESLEIDGDRLIAEGVQQCQKQT